MTITPLRAYSQDVRDAAERLLGDLQAQQLEVAMLDAPRQRHSTHKIRKAVGHNCDWYRDLCAEHPSTAKGRTSTVIRRADIERALEKMGKGTFVGKVVENRLKPYIEDMIDTMKEELTLSPEGNEAFALF